MCRLSGNRPAAAPSIRYRQAEAIPAWDSIRGTDGNHRSDCLASGAATHHLAETASIVLMSLGTMMQSPSARPARSATTDRPGGAGRLALVQPRDRVRVRAGDGRVPAIPARLNRASRRGVPRDQARRIGVHRRARAAGLGEQSLTCLVVALARAHCSEQVQSHGETEFVALSSYEFKRCACGVLGEVEIVLAERCSSRFRMGARPKLPGLDSNQQPSG